jgi:membrane protease subunit HflC
MSQLNPKLIIAGVLGLAILIAFFDGLFIVPETQQVILTQFGEPVSGAISDPGIHWKVPFIQKANFFEKRFLEWDGDPNQVPTKDKRFIWVNTYARWRISEPLKYFQRLRDERRAQDRLRAILDGETRNAVAKYDLVEVVRSLNREPDATLVASEEETAILVTIEKGREAIAQEILETAQHRAADGDLGIEIIDIRFKRINYVEEVQKDVFDRMIAERNRIAQRYRSEGQGEAARIRGEKERDLAQIQSEAYQRSEEVRGAADARSTQIYADAYNRDVTFYTFLKSLETYEQTANTDSTLILTTDSELLRYLKRTP